MTALALPSPAEDLLPYESPVETVDRVEALMIERQLAREVGMGDCPLVHRFAPGIYLREIFMREGLFVIGHAHKTEHFNIVLKGRARVMINGEVEEIVGPCTFKSGVGVRKVLYILSDMIWQTVHPTDKTDISELENDLIIKSPAFLSAAKDLQQLREALLCNL